MKKYFFLTITFLLLISSKLNAQEEEYFVSKIDSTNKVYLITIKNKDFKGVIISDKKNCNYCNGVKKIRTGYNYKLDIRKHDIIKFVNVPYLKVNSKGIPDITYEGINICELNADCIVYQSNNLCGLHIVNK